MSELTGKIGVMNFASPVDPGGGLQLAHVRRKKPLPRGLIWFQPLSSTWQIIMSLIVAKPNRGLFSQKLIYAEHVRQLFDDQGRRLTDKYVDIVTVAAPNRRIDATLDDATVMNDIAFKILQTLRAFKAHDVDQVILGAFGTGVFGNPVAPVAKLFRKALLLPEFEGAFKRVYFAIYDPAMTTIKAICSSVERPRLSGHERSTTA